MADPALNIPSLRDKVSPEAWAVRVDLAACYRLVARYGWEGERAGQRRGALVWPGLLRRLDRLDPSYRT